MTLVLIAKDLVLEGSTTKIEDKQVPGIYIYIIPYNIYIYVNFKSSSKSQGTFLGNIELGTRVQGGHQLVLNGVVTRIVGFIHGDLGLFHAIYKGYKVYPP